ncbi:RNA 2',3'-cyclic phosphodiesterase [Actinospica sp. MGRD01-02]|uniref:RNA 2',3'-cyclic phosphodiesterase n=1 Tax=Actinospica acidithermotolerans TaxID=2828514 RepID=A0A941IJN9_9ACTN|nr:RNA 2',3'-cyclic phosphodiesterase [Actinospica acidithermotolerans]MBR7827293.1 RNA 2',3'-cyclic phosphodiesterase [Actinospica acidithermotolerans]
MRLFVAVVPPRPVLLELRAALSTLPHTDGNLRWRHPESWHITLAFLGDVPRETLPELTERLARAASRATPMELSVAGGGQFDSRVLWAGVQGDRDRLGRLSETVAAAARRCRLKIDDRPYRPHVTLARVRNDFPEGAEAAVAPPQTDLQPYVDRMAAFRTPRWLVKEMELFESVKPATAGRANIYLSRGRWPLTGR